MIYAAIIIIVQLMIITGFLFYISLLLKPKATQRSSGDPVVDSVVRDILKSLE